MLLQTQPCTPSKPAARRRAARAARARAAPARAGRAPGAAASSQQAALLSLTQWLLSSGAKFVPGLRPEILPSGGRGMRTTFDLAPGAALASVPSRLALSSGGPPPPRMPAALWGALPWPARLAALLLIERAAGAESRLAPFMASLPAAADDIGLPAAWAEGEVSQLQCPAILRQVRVVAVCARHGVARLCAQGRASAAGARARARGALRRESARADSGWRETN